AREQVRAGMELDQERQAAAQNRAQVEPRVLGSAFHPAELLRAESVHVDRQLAVAWLMLEKLDAPALELRAIAEVEVLGDGVGAPAAGVLDGLPAPEAA